MIHKIILEFKFLDKFWQKNSSDLETLVLNFKIQKSCRLGVECAATQNVILIWNIQEMENKLSSLSIARLQMQCGLLNH